MYKPLTVIVFLLTSFWHSNVFAVSQANGDTIQDPQQVVQLAKNVERVLANNKGYIALVARVGRNKKDLPAGIEYTHTGIAVYSKIKLKNKTVPGYAMYNLYQRENEPKKSDLIRDFPLDFFTSAHEMQAAVLILSPELQKRVVQTIHSSTYKKLHNNRYSAISNPLTSNLQNCNEFILDIIQASLYKTDNKKRIKELLNQYYTPQELNINPFRIMFGSMLMPDVTTEDHEGIVATATYNSLAKYLWKYDLVAKEFTVTPDGVTEKRRKLKR